MRSKAALATMRKSRNSLDPYPGKYGPQDVRNNFAKNMERNCNGNKRKVKKKRGKRKK